MVFKKTRHGIPAERRDLRLSQTTHSEADALSIEPLEDRTMLATFVPGELLVQFSTSADLAARASVRDLVAGQLVEQIHTQAMQTAGSGILERVYIGADQDLGLVINRLRSLPSVVYAEPNWVYRTLEVSNDTHYLNSNLWGMYSDDSPTVVGPTGTTNQYGSHAEAAWYNGFIGSHNVYVGVIDEGIQITHPDLAANIWTNPFDPIDGIDNDGNGKIDDVNGWDFFNNDSSVYDGTADDHGTHVAGTIGAQGGNGLGVAGVNWNVTMISTKFLGTNGGTTSGAIQSIDYLTDLKTRHGLNIIATSNSWGGGGFSQALLDAITRGANQGILFVAAAGNSNANNDAGSFYPANYNTTTGAGYDAVISVASITNTGAKSSFSSYGATTVDLGAPGSSIYSTLPTNSYGSYSGTSMATPHVSGALALYAAANPGASAQAMRTALFNSVTPTSSLAGITATGGRLNVEALLGAPATTPNLSITDVSVTEGNSGSVFANFTITLSAPASGSVTVNFATADGTATAGSDYAASSGSLTFAPGETSKTISIEVYGDTAVEPNETFTVNLTSPTGATISDGSGTGTIVNDDVAASVSLSVNDVSGYEHQGTLVFTVSLSAASTSTVTVNYATANGTAKGNGRRADFEHTSGTLTFNPGQTSKTVAVTLRDDSVAEPTEYFYLNLSSASGATIADGQGVGTIFDNDGGTSGRSFGDGTTAYVNPSKEPSPAAFAEVEVRSVPQRLAISGTAYQGHALTLTNDELTPVAIVVETSSEKRTWRLAVR